MGLVLILLDTVHMLCDYGVQGHAQDLLVTELGSQEGIEGVPCE
jgi:hypothetical protein